MTASTDRISVQDKPGKSLWQRLIPAPSPVAPAVQIWRNKLVDGIFRVTLVIGFLTTAAGCYFGVKNGDVYKVPIYLGAYAVFVLIALWKRVPYTGKIVFFLGILYALTLLEMSEDGLSGSGRVFMMGATVLAVLLLGRRATLPALALAMLIMGGTAWAFSTGRIEVSMEDLSTTLRPASWATATVSFLLMAAMLVISQNYLIPSLSDALIELERSVAAERTARAEAQDANRMKDVFLATMSHELRTPLNAVMGYLGLMQYSGQLDEDNHHMAGRSIANAERLLNLINNVLDLSRISAGRLEITPGPFSLAAMANKIRDDMELRIREKGLAFDVQIGADLPPSIVHDEERLTQIVTNLLDNAVKFTSEGQIQLAFNRNDGRMVVQVADTGIGIPLSKQQLIFDEFTQVDSSPTRRHGGAGLGLSIVKRLALLMDGNVRVASEVGKGSVFTVEIPLTLAHTEARSASVLEGAG